MLIEHSFTQAVNLGYDTVVIFGSPVNYVGRGFKSCKKYNICIENGKYPSAMMVKEPVSYTHLLRGKNKPIFTPHMDCGDYVIVVNADKVVVTGKKLDQKIYYNHSDYVGGMRETTLKEMMAKKPEKVVELAVKGMLPKGPLGRSMMDKLHV